MALTYTPAGELGSQMPSFELNDVQGKHFSSANLKTSAAKVVAFICAHCPYVQAIENRLIQLGSQLKEIGVPLVAICSNDPTEYPEDSPEQLKKRSEEKGYSFTYLVDASQEVAKAFGAVCTPDFFVYDSSDKLVYRGRLDDSWKNPEKVTKQELLQAVDAVVNKTPIPEIQHPSLGCSIKWK